jgi:formyl-CoA transferase
MKNAAALNAIVQAGLRADREGVRELLEKRGVPSAKVRNPNRCCTTRTCDNGAVMSLVHPRFGDIGAVGMGLRSSFPSEAQFDQPATGSAPPTGRCSAACWVSPGRS